MITIKPIVRRSIQKIFIAALLCTAGNTIFAQTPANKAKPPIDEKVYNTWPAVFGSPVISKNGQFVFYTIRNQPIGKSTLVIQSTDTKWKKEFPELDRVEFSPDSRYAIYKKRGDSLVLISLGKEEIEYIPNVSMYRLPVSGDWLVCQLNSAEKKIIARNLKTKKELVYDQVSGFWLSNDGKALILQTSASTDKSLQSLLSITLENGKQKILWEGNGISNLMFDRESRMAFLANEKSDNQTIRTVFYYKPGMEKALPVIQETAATVPKGLKIDKLTRFDRKGERIFIILRENKPFKPQARPKPDAVKVTVWSYQDATLQSGQAGNTGAAAMMGSGNEEFIAVIDMEKHKLIRLEQEPGEFLHSAELQEVFLTSTLKKAADGYEQYWNKAISQPLNMIFAKDGKRVSLDDVDDAAPSISPAEKFLVYFNRKENDFFTYEIANGIKRNITKDIPVNLVNSFEDHVGAMPVSPAGWLKNDEAVIIYDQFDIWMIDPLAVKAPVNITNGFGRKHDLIFRVLDESNLITIDKGRLLLNAFNQTTKDNGFYSLQLNKKNDPELLSVGPYVYHLQGKAAPRTPAGIPPVKAGNAEIYIVKRMSASEYPNVFSTSDFRTFTPLTNLEPQKDYNWMTTEVHSWKDPNGKTVQGILYKPEDFDPAKKYPVIFYYYERVSDGANIFQEPQYSDGRLNIAWYVSNGYLVFRPDILITTGEPGQSAVNAVVSGAEYLSQKPYVNPKKMGIQGISYGGFETYYLVTHTNLFAAACSAAGFTDFMSWYNYLWANRIANQTVMERGQVRMGGTLWEISEKYIRNSPIMNADKVTTPLLMLGGRIDYGVPISQAIEFYLAMRRLGKRAWLLDYEEGDHGLFGKDAADYDRRMIQFFDHYLKDEPAPKWMLEGIPANKRGIESGFELIKQKDANGHWITPGEGLLKKD